MTWRCARSLDTLLDQINDLAPRRSKASDGALGDPAHAARASDHNPVRGVVHARDFTHDPRHGLDAHALADRLLKAQDPRLKYVISRGRIGSGPRGPQPGVWRDYDGDNPHDKHVHVSVVAGRLGDQAHPWVIGPTRPAVTATPTPTPVQEDAMALLVISAPAGKQPAKVWEVRPASKTRVHIDSAVLDLLTKTERARISVVPEAKLAKYTVTR